MYSAVSVNLLSVDLLVMYIDRKLGIKRYKDTIQKFKNRSNHKKFWFATDYTSRWFGSVGQTILVHRVQLDLNTDSSSACLVRVPSLISL